MPSPYSVGSENTLTATFRDSNGDLYDPDSILLTYGHVDDEAIEEEYPGEIDRDSLGVFSLIFTPDVPGSWTARWVGLGDENSVIDQAFSVAPAVVTKATYATLTEFKHWLESDPDDPQNFLDDALLQWCLGAATDDISLATGRSFAAVTDTRYYGSRDGRTLYVDDLTAITEIATDIDGDGTYETVWTSDDYGLERDNVNLTDDAFTTIHTSEGGSLTFPTRLRGVRVAASFGATINGSAPDLIRMACIIGANRWLHRRGSPLGTETATDAQGTASIRQIKADYDYDRAISRYTRKAPAVLLTIDSVNREIPSIFRLAPGRRGL